MKSVLLLLSIFGFTLSAYARPPKNRKIKTVVNYRGDCQPGTSSVDLAVNNVRARLLSRGDMWWDYNEGRYEVPVGSGISSIYAGAIWMGGYDAAGNLHVSASDYENDGGVDFYPGPLEFGLGETSPEVCQNWDRHFVVYGNEISKFISDWAAAKFIGIQIQEDLIPENLKMYPARGNPFFANMPNGFILPDQNLAPFFDQNMDGIYNPLDGDYPVLSIHGCDGATYASQMVYQIFNDAGPHNNSEGIPLKFEVQQQSFAFATDDELNDMTFMSYRIVSHSADTIFDTYFSLWMDADIGCSDDDYIGCDTTRSLVFFYNGDGIDGDSLGNCMLNGVNTPTYGTEIPILGVDLLRGPVGDLGENLTMSSFIFLQRKSLFPPFLEKGLDFYRAMQGLWKDGSPIYAGGSGYHEIEFPETKFIFSGVPDDISSWSMVQQDSIKGDFRTVQSVGSFTLNPGSINEMIYGLPWVPNVPHPAPSLETLLAADDKAQALFDNCFEGIILAEKTPETVVDLVVFPNPMSDYLRIQSYHIFSTVQLQLFNMAGQVVLAQKIDQNSEIGVRYLPKGVYGYKISDLLGRKMASGKVAKD